MVFAIGLITAARATPPMRPIRLVDRVAPYVGDTSQASKLLEAPIASSAPFTVVRRLFAPFVGDLVRMVDRLVGGSGSVRRRLGGLGGNTSVEEFRIEQVVWGVVAMLAGAGLVAAATAIRGGADPLLVGASALVSLVSGVLARDWWLGRQLERRERAMLAEFPVVADLVALSVVAGEAPVDALQRVCRLTHGELARDLDSALARFRAGTPITRALTDLAERTTFEPFSRFIQGLVVALERGTPLAEVLRAQAVDAREVSKRALLEAGGQKEITMMVPVVFLILPLTVLFALYPGLVTLVSVAK